METGTPRFNRAVNKLYNAFVDGELNPMDCKACAVGNMCDNNYQWKYFKFSQPTLRGLGQAENCIKPTGYSAEEILNIESLYMNGCLVEHVSEADIEMSNSCILEKDRPEHLNLKALLLVIDYLAELDGIKVPQIKELFASKELPKLEPCTA